MQTFLQYPNQHLSPQNIMSAGMVVSVPALYGTVRHYGISSNPGFVIDKSFKLGKVAERPIQDFFNGNDLRLEGHWGVLDPLFVLQNARERIGEPWTLRRNCEHFVRECHGLKSESPQLSRAVSSVLIGAVLLQSRSSR